jgi:hypothetical protein
VIVNKEICKKILFKWNNDNELVKIVRLLIVL